MGDCFKSTGSINKISRDLNDFSKLEVHDDVHVFLVRDSINYCEVEAGNNLLDLIRTNSDGHTLRISNENKCRFMRKYDVPVKVILHYKSISALTYYGSGDIKSLNAITDTSFTLDCWGASGIVDLELDVNVAYAAIHTATADIILSGNSPLFYPYLGGNGHMDAGALNTNHTYLRTVGTGDVTVRAKDVLVAEVEHTGNVLYFGNPEVIPVITGSGTITRLGN